MSFRPTPGEQAKEKRLKRLYLVFGILIVIWIVFGWPVW
jgi:hypothetical protein